MNLSNTQLLEKLAAAGIDTTKNVSIADRFYAEIKLEFLKGKFSSVLSSWIFQLFGGYKTEVRDCDDFAKWVSAQAQLWNSETSGTVCALAFGECWYEKDSGESHAINIAIVENGDVVFYEPQTQKVVELSDREIWGVSNIRF